MSKIALKGFCAARFWPITANTKTTYTTDVMSEFVGARNLTKDETRNEYTIPGDDGVYDTGSDYLYEDLEFTVNELPLSIEAQLRGYTYDELTTSYIVNKGDSAIEFAFGYAAKRLDNEYRMWKLYLCKVMKIKVDHTTIEEGQKDVQVYKITIRNTSRLADGNVETVQDSSDGTYTWLNTVDQVPAA